MDTQRFKSLFPLEEWDTAAEHMWSSNMNRRPLTAPSRSTSTRRSASSLAPPRPDCGTRVLQEPAWLTGGREIRDGGGGDFPCSAPGPRAACAPDQGDGQR